jgi:hypothetical protein
MPNASNVSIRDSSNTVQTVSTIDQLIAVGSPVTALPAGANTLGSVKLTDGTSVPGVAPANTAANTSQPALVVSFSPASVGVIATGTQASPSNTYISAITAGDVAAAASDTGNPIKIGGVGHTANPTAVTDGQRVNAMFDKLGKQVTIGALRDLKGSQITTFTASTTETTIVTGGATNVFHDLYGLIIENTSNTATEFVVRDVTSTGKQYAFYLPAGDTRGFMLPVDSAIPQGTANSAWTGTCTTSVSSVKVAALFVTNS